MNVSMGRSEAGSFRVEDTTAVVGARRGFMSKPFNAGSMQDSDMVDSVVPPWVEVPDVVRLSLVMEAFEENEDLFLRHVPTLSSRFRRLPPGCLTWYKTPESV